MEAFTAKQVADWLGKVQALRDNDEALGLHQAINAIVPREWRMLIYCAMVNGFIELEEWRSDNA